MKSNKGILTILDNLAQFILQSRVSPSQLLKEHFDALQTELRVLRSQLLPSTELIHFLVQRHSYNLKNKINNFLKSASPQQLTITITFSLTDKGTSLTDIAEMWKLAVVTKKQREVSRQSKAHQLLFLIERLFQRLHSKEPFNEMIRNGQASKKYLIDFQIDIKERNSQSITLKQLGKVTFNSASLDNSRQLHIQCYSNSKLQLHPIILNKQTVNNITSIKYKRLKNSLEVTRADSLDQEQHTSRRKYISEQTFLEIYDSELDITILSSGSEFGSKKLLQAAGNQDQMDQFELLIEDTDRDQLFLQQNMEAFNDWQVGLLQNFT